jgi:hypothetical protein
MLQQRKETRLLSDPNSSSGISALFAADRFSN